MGRKTDRIDKTIDRRAKARRYTPRPHPEVTAALEAAGFRAESVYGAKRWERTTFDFVRLGAAFHALTIGGWRVTGAGAYGLRYPAETRLTDRRFGLPMVSLDERAARLRLELDRNRGLSYVFDRSPEAIQLHLDRYRAFMAALNDNPVKRLASDPHYAGFLTSAEREALADFVNCFARFHAAIGNTRIIGASGEGVPMTEAARRAAQDAYTGLCAAILAGAGPRALSACQDLAGNQYRPDRRLLQAAAQAMAPDWIPPATFLARSFGATT